MEKNKTGKYFKYAIGEIVLVVIGILIALSINNWNQERIQNNEILKIQQRIIIDINDDIRDL
ncbi:MAG: sensor domain CHASE-containing protein, partial [Ulvibacter sp.]